MPRFTGPLGYGRDSKVVRLERPHISVLLDQLVGWHVHVTGASSRSQQDWIRAALRPLNPCGEFEFVTGHHSVVVP